MRKSNKKVGFRPLDSLDTFNPYSIVSCGKRNFWKLGVRGPVALPYRRAFEVAKGPQDDDHQQSQHNL